MPSPSPLPPTPSPNVTATARIGSRVLRCVGESAFKQWYVNELLDLFIEHVHQEARRAQQPSPLTTNWRVRFTEL